MKRLLLFLLLLASIGCKKELAPQGAQRDYNTANYENGEGRYALFLRYRYDFYWRGDGSRGITPERMRLDIKGSLILGLGDTAQDDTPNLIELYK